MINRLLEDTIDKFTPKFNPDVVNGMATSVIPEACKYIDLIIKSNMEIAPEGFVYEGYRRLNPIEEFETLFSKSKKKIEFDIAKSDLYKIELSFSYNGKPLPKRYLALPFVEDGGIMHISGNKYHIIPVLSDTVISPNHKEVFIRLLRIKIFMQRIFVNIRVIENGYETIEDVQVVHSTMFNTARRSIKNSKLGNVVPPIALYMTSKFGFKESFTKYNYEAPIITYDEINPADYPDYKIYKTAMTHTMKPKGVRDNSYRPHSVKILIKNTEKSQYVQTMIFGIMYAFDVLPHNVNEIVDYINGNSKKDEIFAWTLLFGNILFKNSYSSFRVVPDMKDHFMSLDSFIDVMVKTKLAEIDIHVNDFYDLLSVTMENYAMWILKCKEHSNDIYKRYLSIDYYILYELTACINRALFNISKEGQKKKLEVHEINRAMDKQITPVKIYKIVKSGAMNIALLLVEYVGDNMYYKITSSMELQERGNGVQKASNKNNKGKPGPTLMATGYGTLLGSVLYITKTFPSMLGKINPYAPIEVKTGRIKPDEDLKEAVEKLNKLMSARAENVATIENNIKNNESDVKIDLV